MNAHKYSLLISSRPQSPAQHCCQNPSFYLIKTALWPDFLFTFTAANQESACYNCTMHFLFLCLSFTGELQVSCTVTGREVYQRSGKMLEKLKISSELRARLIKIPQWWWWDTNTLLLFIQLLPLYITIRTFIWQWLKTPAEAGWPVKHERLFVFIPQGGWELRVCRQQPVRAKIRQTWL